MRVAIVWAVAGLLLAVTASVPASGVVGPAGGGGVTAGVGAKLTLRAASPVVVAGSGFHRRARVLVWLACGGTLSVRGVRATRSGPLAATFQSADVSRPWTLFLVRASGGRGSGAWLVRHPVPDCIAD